MQIDGVDLFKVRMVDLGFIVEVQLELAGFRVFWVLFRFCYKLWDFGQVINRV